MSASGRTGVFLAVLTMWASGVAAQWPVEVAPGARIRVRLPEVQYQWDGPRGHLVRGRVTGLSPDTLYLAVADSVGSLAIPRPLIQRADISRGAPSRGLSALQRGVITGAGGAMWGLLTTGLYDEPDQGEAALIGGGIGLAMGAVFGAIFPHERWKRVKVEAEP
ncbi:MAG: hypothetical protein ACREM9_03840 [Gemmatimonadales bacterium]